eukprot:NODE_345_length_10548_cov_0.306728.p5 type:complete len:229 gc:universal NODE_345_length_10548_cov_0.306728:7468-8154(+)
MDIAKRAACKGVVDEIKRSNLIGIGSGSTIVYLFELMRQELSREELMSKIFVPTSYQSESLIIENGLTRGTLNQFPILDVVVDGADEVTVDKTAIKGGGGCHYLEKLVYSASKKKIIVVDDSKLSSKLGAKWKYVPVEVDMIALKIVQKSLIQMGYSPELRMSRDKAGPVITDQGNCILDLQLNSEIKNVKSMYEEIKLLPGVLEVGLFWGFHVLCVGKSNSTFDLIQ